MIPELREEFNAHFTEERYQELLRSIETASGCPTAFRIAESPLFLPRSFMERAARAAEDILLRAASTELQTIGAHAVPDDFRYADETAKPLFAAVDFAITGSSTAPDIKLIELQGFPSLYHFQSALSILMRDVYALPQSLTGLAHADESYESYYRGLKQAIVGDHDPKHVVLLELSPYNQKTLPDFLLAEKHLGLAIVDIASVEARGKELYYTDRTGKRHRIARIYNRAIRDDIVRQNARIPFDITQQYNVEWAGHPNWFFRISKVLLPQLVGTNDAVPNACLLSDAKLNEIDLSNYVLKPLYSFAGAGVVLSPTRQDVEGISVHARQHWLLQERVTYADVFQTPDGNGVRAEVRMMLLWPEEQERPRAVHTLVRLTRGAMIGVNQNASLPFSGSSAALIT